MHHVSGLFYVGQPNETVSLTTKVAAGGQLNVSLDGQSIAANTQFRLPASPGGQSTLQIALFGPAGSSCAVGLAVVDGGTDVDFLLCQASNPAPVHIYTFAVASSASLTTLAKMKTLKPTRKGPKAGRTRSQK